MRESGNGGCEDPSGQRRFDRKGCVMCGKRRGDRLLDCVEPECPVAFHVKCYPLELNSDRIRNFLCPFCSFKAATARVDEVKKKATLAKQTMLRSVGAAGKEAQRQTTTIASASNHQNQGNDAIPLKDSGSPAKRVTKAALPNVKRKRLKWTDQEVEMLEEGVRKFSEGNKNLPWKKILDFGSGTFDSTRAPIDLQNKWKNMQKKNMKESSVQGSPGYND